MNNLTEDVLNIIGKLYNVHTKKANLQSRIQTLEQKLSMTREASLALTNEEQELVSSLQAHGIQYGHYTHAPTSQMSGTPVIQPEQLTNLLVSLFNQQYSAISPTSIGMNGMYGYQPGKSLIPQGAISPTSGVVSPTSGTNIYARN